MQDNVLEGSRRRWNYKNSVLKGSGRQWNYKNNILEGSRRRWNYKNNVLEGSRRRWNYKNNGFSDPLEHDDEPRRFGQLPSGTPPKHQFLYDSHSENQY